MIPIICQKLDQYRVNNSKESAYDCIRYANKLKRHNLITSALSHTKVSGTWLSLYPHNQHGQGYLLSNYYYYFRRCRYC